MEGIKDGQFWRIGGPAEVAWIADSTDDGLSVTSAIPPVFEAYATVAEPHDGDVELRERALIDELTTYTPEQVWWLGFLDTGAHDVVFPHAPKVSLYWDWHYVLVEAGPAQARTWRTGHMRAESGVLPDLFFPAGRSWLVSALWDDTWISVGGGADLINALHWNAAISAYRVGPDDDAVPPGVERE